MHKKEAMKIDKYLERVYGKLTITEFSHKVGNNKYYKAVCDCGDSRTAYIGNLTSGKVTDCKSCVSKKTGHSIKAKRVNHGESKTELYRAWAAMKAASKSSIYYAFRSYPKEWESFVGFKADMGEGFFQGATLDRVNYNDNYCKDNCKWINSYR